MPLRSIRIKVEQDSDTKSTQKENLLPLTYLLFFRISVYFGLCYCHVPCKWTAKIRMVLNVRPMHL